MRPLLRPVDKVLSYVPTYKKWRKYNRELNYWKRELEHLKQWWVGTDIFWGVEPVKEDTRDFFSTYSDKQEIESAVAYLTTKRPHYKEHLQIERIQGKILEVGCGPIPGILHFPALCTRFGIDPLINEYIKMGWPLYEYPMIFVNGYAEDMPFPDNYFDAIIAVNSLDHVDNFEKTAQEIQRVLKPQGKLYMEIESHKPRPCEPQQININDVKKSFNKCALILKKRRSKKQLFKDIENRFGLLQILPDDAFGDEEVMLLWGTKIG